MRCAGQLVLELCDGAEDLKSHAAARRIGAQPIHERAESGPPFRPAGPPQQVFERAPQARQPAHHEHVAGAHVRKRLLTLSFVSRWFPALNCYCRLDKPKTFPRRGHACTDQHILGWLSIFCSGAVIPSSVIFYRIAPLCLH